MSREKLPFRLNCEGYFVTEDGKILARDTGKGFLCFPGGGVDNDEDVIKAILRETFEETGAIVENVDTLGSVKFIWGPDWAKTDKQKQRYNNFKGEHMHFFTGIIKGFKELNELENDFWEGEKLMPIQEAIDYIESQMPFDDFIKDYRESQLRFLNKLKESFLDKNKNVPVRDFQWPEITDETRKAVINQMDESISIYDKSGIIEKLEDKFKELHGKKHALLTNSGTSALYSLFVASGLGMNDEIICPAYTFFATISPIFSTGAVPILADCLKDGNIDPEDIKKKITHKTKAIIVTHMWGKPCEMDEIVKIAKEHNLILLEDCSHAHFAKYNGKYIGTFGDAAAFSIQGQKTLTGGEGGIIITDNDDIFYKALLHGHYNKRCKNEIPKEYPLAKFAITGMGLKFRIHPLAAAIAYQQLEKIEDILENKRVIAKRLIDGLKGLPGLGVSEVVNEGVNPSWYAFIIKYKPEELGGLDINTFYDDLVKEGCTELDIPGSTCPLNILPLFQNPSELFPNYKGKVHYNVGDFPKAEKFHNSILKLPVWSDKKYFPLVDAYIEAFKKVIKKHKGLDL